MPLLEEDLTHVRRHADVSWGPMHGKSVFLTGGSGFLGRWLVESLLHANRTLQLGVRLTMLTRSAARFGDIAPHLVAEPALSIVEGNIRDFAFPPGRFDYLIHAAADTALSVGDPVAAIDTEVAGFQRTFSFAVDSQVSRMLLVSSGAVYGARKTNEPISEDAPCDLNPARRESRYGELKRLGELYGASYASQYGLEVVIARCFSLFGPYQNLDSHFAIANFLRDATAARDIVIRGDGLDRRSYLYAGDVAIWLWRLLISGRSCVPYNVGSKVPISLLELANTIARVAGTGSRVRVLGGERQGLAGSIYLPQIDRARQELGLGQLITLDEGIRRTLQWSRQ
jgi:nucleoside-diphosphate-sugar epimerase